MLSEEEKSILLSSAISNYVFNKVFEKHNDGKVFSIEKFFNAIEKIVSDPLFNISQEKQRQLSQCLYDLDQFAVKDINEDVEQQKTNLTLV